MILFFFFHQICETLDLKPRKLAEFTTFCFIFEVNTMHKKLLFFAISIGCLFIFNLSIFAQTSNADPAPPKPVADLKPEKVTMSAKISLGGQELPLSIASETKEENGSWSVTDTVQTPQGEITETAILEKGTLFLKKRTINQAGTIIEFEVKDGKAVGTSGGKPFSVDLGGELFADGAGTFNVIAALPLAEGYSTTVRNFDVDKQVVEMKNIKVVGTEKVTVHAGTFEAYKVESVSANNPADKTTAWISKDRVFIKIESVLVNLGGAMLTAERQ